MQKIIDSQLLKLVDSEMISIFEAGEDAPLTTSRFAELPLHCKLPLLLKPNIIGLEAARQSMSHETVVQLNRLLPESEIFRKPGQIRVDDPRFREQIGHFLDWITRVPELSGFKSKMSERKVLNEINKKITFKVKGAIKTPALKVKVLLQAHLMNLTISNWEMKAQIREALKILNRVLRLSKKIYLEGRNWLLLVLVLYLERSLRNSWWLLDPLRELKQLTSVTQKTAKSILSCGVSSLRKMDLSSLEMLRILLKNAKINPSVLSSIFREVKCIPQIEVKLEEAQKGNAPIIGVKYVRRCEHSRHNRFHVIIFSETSSSLHYSVISKDTSFKKLWNFEKSANLKIIVLNFCFHSADVIVFESLKKNIINVNKEIVQKTEKKVFGFHKLADESRGNERKSENINQQQSSSREYNQKSFFKNNEKLILGKNNKKKKNREKQKANYSQFSKASKKIGPLSFIGIINKKRQMFTQQE